MTRRLASFWLLLALGTIIPLAGGPMRLCLASGAIGSCGCEAEQSCCSETGDSDKLPCCVELPESPEALPADGAFLAPELTAIDLPGVSTRLSVDKLLPRDPGSRKMPIRPPPRHQTQVDFGVWRL